MRRAFRRYLVEGFLGAPSGGSGRRRRKFLAFLGVLENFGAFWTFSSVLGPNTGSRGILEGFALNADSQGFLGIPGRLPGIPQVSYQPPNCKQCDLPPSFLNPVSAMTTP